MYSKSEQRLSALACGRPDFPYYDPQKRMVVSPSGHPWLSLPDADKGRNSTFVCLPTKLRRSRPPVTALPRPAAPMLPSADSVPVMGNITFHCIKVAEKLKADITREKTQMFALIGEDNKLRKRVGKNSTLRLAWSGYAARTLFRHGIPVATGWEPESDTVDYTRILRSLGYDREAELKRPMVIAMSGDLETDLAANFVARTMSKYTYTKFIEAISSLYNDVISAAIACVQMGFNGAELFPRIETTIDGIEKFFDELTSVPSDENLNHYWNAARHCGLIALKQGSPSFRAAYTAPAAVTTYSGDKISTILPAHALVDTHQDVEICHRVGGISLQYLLGNASPTFDKETGSEARSPLFAINQKEAAAMQSALYTDSIIWAERRAMEAARQAQADTCKLQDRIKELEEQLATAKGENERLKAKSSPKAGEVTMKLSAVSGMQRQIQKAEAKVARLEKENAQLRNNAENVATARREARELRQQLEARDAQIDTLLETMDAAEDEKDAAEEILDTSVFNKLNVVVVGGHPNLVSTLQAINPNIRCFGTKRPPDAVICHADIVWLQTNFIDHDVSIPVNKLCRQYNIPLHFFRGTGIFPNRNQFIKETGAFFDALNASPTDDVKS